MNSLLAIVYMITAAQAQLCPENYSVELTNRTYNGLEFSSNEMYVDEDGVERGCICMKKACVRKCCPNYEAWYEECGNSSVIFDPKVLANDDKEVASEDIHVITGIVNCSNGKERLLGLSEYDFYVKTDGRLRVVMAGDSEPTVFGLEDYCIDHIKDEDRMDLLPVFCHLQKENTLYVLNSFCMLVSCFFILLTVGVYAWLPELRNLHGMVLMAYLCCLFVTFAVLAPLSLRSQPDNSTCVILTFIIYFSTLAAFFWLNVMCYDIWWTFSYRSTTVVDTPPRTRFYKFCAYAFGMPTALTSLLAISEYVVMPFENPLKPDLKNQKCFFDGYVKLVYLYIPMLVLCTVNIILFIVTAVKIAYINKDTAKARRNCDGDTNRYFIYVKLFTIMGVSWILEVVKYYYQDVYFIWRLTDVYNALMGFLIFVLFVFKKKIWKLIAKRYKSLRGKPLTHKSETQLTGSSHTQSTQSVSDRRDLNVENLKKQGAEEPCLNDLNVDVEYSDNYI